MRKIISLAASSLGDCRLELFVVVFLFFVVVGKHKIVTRFYTTTHILYYLGWVVQKPVNANLGLKLTKVSVSLVTKHLHC